MRTTGNTVLITGGSSGIGRGLAEAFHRLGNQVVIAGRRQAALDAVTASHPGMRSVKVDIDSTPEVRAFATRIMAEFPDLDVLVNNAGIQHPEDLTAPASDFSLMEATIATNLLAPMRLTSLLMPALLRRPGSVVMNVTSTLAFLPGAFVPTYSATKAALHSWTQSLRHQLRHAAVEVIELIPPYVQTALGPGHGSDPRAMPLAEFVDEVMALLKGSTDCREVVVERARAQRFAVEEGRFDVLFAALNGNP